MCGWSISSRRVTISHSVLVRQTVLTIHGDLYLSVINLSYCPDVHWPDCQQLSGRDLSEFSYASLAIVCVCVRAFRGVMFAAVLRSGIAMRMMWIVMVDVWSKSLYSSTICQSLLELYQ